MTDLVAIYMRSSAAYCHSELDLDTDSMLAQLHVLGITARSPQQRLLPAQVLDACKSITNCPLQQCHVSYTPCTVIEVEKSEFVKNQDEIMKAGFDIWPDEDDFASTLYGSSLDGNGILEAGQSSIASTNLALMEPDAPATEQQSHGHLDEQPPGEPAQPDVTADVPEGLDVLYGKFVRVYQAGEPVSGDHVENRINIGLHATNNRIVEFWTG